MSRLFLILCILTSISGYSQNQKRSLESDTCICTPKKARKVAKRIAWKQAFWKMWTLKYKYKVVESYVYYPDGYWRVEIYPKNGHFHGAKCVILSKACKFYKWMPHY